MRQVVALAFLLSLFVNAGCMVTLGSWLIPEKVTVHRERGKQRVTIDSEPQGAQVMRDGVAVGTTPTEIEFEYEHQTPQTRLKPCGLLVPLGALDVAAGGVGVWESWRLLSSRKSGRPFWALDSPGVWGLVGMLAATAYALAGFGIAGSRVYTGCGIPYGTTGKGPSEDIRRDYPLRLVTGKWEAPLNVRVPTLRLRASAVFRGLEESDWHRIESVGTIEAYDEYLAKYPSARWRKEASERRLGKLFESTPDRIDKKTLAQLLVGENPTLRARALVESIRRHATADVEEQLSDMKIELARRKGLLTTLKQFARAPEPSDHAAKARTILCNFGSSKTSDEDREKLVERACRDEWQEQTRTDFYGGKYEKLSFSRRSRYESNYYDTPSSEGRTGIHICGLYDGHEKCENFSSDDEVDRWRRQREEESTRCKSELSDRLDEENAFRVAAQRAGNCSTEKNAPAE